MASMPAPLNAAVTACTSSGPAWMSMTTLYRCSRTLNSFMRGSVKHQPKPLPHDIRAGDWLYVVYDPERDLVDTTNEQHYRRQIVWPIKLRVHAITWPVESGMAV